MSLIGMHSAVRDSFAIPPVATKWKYLKGSEKDFDGAPEWATMLVSGGEFVSKWFLESFVAGNQQHIRNNGKIVFLELENDSSEYEIIAQREPITNVTVNISAPCGEDDLNDCIGQHHCREKVGGLYMDGKQHTAHLDGTNCRCKPSDVMIQGIPINEINGTETVTYNKYLREIKPGVWVDIYDVLKAWDVTNPALQHLIKKAAQPGERGHKTREQDLQDIIDSAIRAKELEQK